MKRILFSLLCLLFWTIPFQAEVFKDSDFKYKITIPEGAEVNHYPEQNHNLNFILPDSSAFFYVYALDINQLPKDEYQSDDTKTVFRKDYIADLDEKVFKLPTDSMVLTKSRWIDEKQRIYYFEDGTQAITRTYFHEDYPHIVAVFGSDLDRTEVQNTLDSFRTPKFEFTIWSILLGIGILVLLFGLWCVFESNGLEGLAGLFMVLTGIWFFVLILGGPMGLFHYLWYWI